MKVSILNGRAFPVALVGGLLAFSAMADTIIWNGGGANNHWTNGANWVGGNVPLPTDDVQLMATNTPSNRLTIDLNGHQVCNSLIFNYTNTAVPYIDVNNTLNTLTLTSGNITNASLPKMGEARIYAGIKLGASGLWGLGGIVGESEGASSGLRIYGQIGGSDPADPNGTNLTITVTGARPIFFQKANATYAGNWYFKAPGLDLPGPDIYCYVDNAIGPGTLTFAPSINNGRQRFRMYPTSATAVFSNKVVLSGAMATNLYNQGRLTFVTTANKTIIFSGMWTEGRMPPAGQVKTEFEQDRSTPIIFSGPTPNYLTNCQSTIGAPVRVDKVDGLPQQAIVYFGSLANQPLATLLFNVSQTHAGLISFDNWAGSTMGYAAIGIVTQGTLRMTGQVTLGGSGGGVGRPVASFIVTNVADSRMIFSGRFIRNTGAGTTTPGVVKRGAGTAILTHTDSTFPDPMEIEGGTLLVDGKLSLCSNVFVRSGATLGGSGTIAFANTLVQSGACLAPGAETNGIGVLTVSNLTFAANSSYCWDGNATTGDVVRVLNSATLPAAMTVAVTRVDSSLLKGAAVILTSPNAITGDPSGWSTVPPKYFLRLSPDGKQVLLRSNPTGTCIVVL